MSAKNLDAHHRWRSVTVAFRVSPEEDQQVERLVQALCVSSLLPGSVSKT